MTPAGGGAGGRAVDGPLVSIVTPSYNQARFIEETILSVQGQTYPSVEHIVVDGGSTDGTLEILTRHADAVTWISEPDRGQSDAINKGLGMARGEILAYLNSDDTYLPTALETAVATFAQHPAIVVVYGDSNIIDEDGRRLKPRAARPFDFADLLMGNYIPQTSTFFRREVLQTVGLFDVRLHYGMDYEYWLRVGARYPEGIRYVPVALANCRRHPATKMVAHEKLFVPEALTVIEKFYARTELPACLPRPRAYYYSRSLLAVGRLFFAELRLAEARGLFLRAIRASPPVLYRTEVVPILVKTLLGVRLVDAIRRRRSGGGRG